MPKFFLTTPSYRTYADPHLGTAYPVVVADAVARYQRMKGMEVVLATSVQECPQRVAGTPAAPGGDLSQIAETMTRSYAAAWEALGISHERFIRSSRPQHQENVQELLVRLFRLGDIYWGPCQGWFCLSCEMLWQPWQLPEAAASRCPNPECQRELEWLETNTYLFRMAGYVDRLAEYFETHPYSIQPEVRRQEILRRFQGTSDRAWPAVTDPYVTRVSNWGVPVPPQLPRGAGMRVSIWFDLLLQYLSAAWYGEDEDKFRQFWPPDVHWVGSDLLGDYHVSLWPILLMACNLPLPKSIFIHGFWQYQGVKISKSSGPRISPVGVVEAVARLSGCDKARAAEGVRYFLLREPAIVQGAEFSLEALTRRFNTELAGGLSWVLERTLRVIRHHYQGMLPPASPAGTEVHEVVEGCWQEADRAYDALDVPAALASAWGLIARLRQVLEEVEPHLSPKEHTHQATLAAVAQGLASVAVMLAPVMPTVSHIMLRKLGALPEPTRHESWPTGWDLISRARSATLISRDATVGKGPPIFPAIRSAPGAVVSRW